MTIEEIVAALMSSHRADLENVRRYIQWIRLRRRVTDRFFFQAHWITTRSMQLPARSAHWI